MVKLSGYVPSSVLAVFRPASKDGGTTDVCEEFIRLTGHRPDLSEGTPSLSACIGVSRSDQIASDEENNVILILHGELYDATGPAQAKLALDRYLATGADFVKDINGSFSIVILDKRQDVVLAFTDRLNSRRLFYSQYRGCFWISSSLKLHPTSTDLDLTGLACYLANGAVFNNRTIFEGVSVLERGSIHRLERDGLQSTPYWVHRFTNEYAGLDEAKLRRELADLLVESVRVRSGRDEKLFVSLSGGYDSATILGILVSHLRIRNIDCCSYKYGELRPETDAGVAKQIADYLGVPYTVAQSYSGDLVSALRTNADVGYVMNKYCEDAEVWFGFRDSLQSSGRSALFVGDECFGDVPFLRQSPIRSMDDVLECVGIHDFSRWSWLSPFLEKNAYRSMRDGWREERNLIVQKCPPSDDHLDYKDFLYLQQRVNHIIFPWRHCIMGEHVIVRQPLLDRSILDFMSRIPAARRLWKRFYVDTVTEMFPEVFNIGITRTPGSYPNWAREFVAQRAAIEGLLAETSALDSVISPDAVTRLLDRIGLLQSGTAQAIPAKLIKRLQASRRTFKAMRLITGVTDEGPDYERVSEVHMAQRLLVLRLVLSRQQR